MLAAGYKEEELDYAATAAICRQKGVMPLEVPAPNVPGHPTFWRCSSEVVYQEVEQTDANCAANGLELVTIADEHGEPIGACKRPMPRVATTRAGFLAARTQPQLEQGVALAASGDKAAFTRFVATQPGVFITKPGVAVDLVDTGGLLASTVKLRKRGELAEFWTVREALELP